MTDINKINEYSLNRFSWDYEDCIDAQLWFLMAAAYQEVCEALLKYMIETETINSFHHALVADSLMEHAVELFMKAGIAQSGKTVQTHHRLQELYNQFRKLYPGKKFDFTCSIDEFVAPSTRTPENQFARYPIDKAGKRWGGNTHIDLTIYYKEASKLLDDFKRLEPLMIEKYSSDSR